MPVVFVVATLLLASACGETATLVAAERSRYQTDRDTVFSATRAAVEARSYSIEREDAATGTIATSGPRGASP